MRKFWSGILAAAVASSVGLAAQGAGRGRDAAVAQEPTPGKEVTVNGCLQSAPAPPSGAAAAASTPKYVLNIKPAGGGRGNAGTRYRLDGEEKTMSRHLNHVVEVNGVVQPPGAANGEIPLKVAWVKMVAATCP